MYPNSNMELLCAFARKDAEMAAAKNYDMKRFLPGNDFQIGKLVAFLKKISKVKQTDEPQKEQIKAMSVSVRDLANKNI